MRVAIAGAHGQIGSRLATRLVAGGDEVVGLIRNPDHAAELEALGAQPAVCDLESAAEAEVATAVAGCDAVVFAAGAGPGSGAARKLTMDRDGAIKLVRAAEAIRARYLMVSSVGAENPPRDNEAFSVYLQAKADADAALVASGLVWTIVRPGPLTNDPGRGRVRLATEPFREAVPRDDVAALLEALLRHPAANRLTLYLGAGETAIDQALATLAGA
jgi:uncharacterized protein YbjT (DUF2867 family)